MESNDNILRRELAKLAISEAGAVALFSRLEVNRAWALEQANNLSLFTEDELRLSLEVVFDSQDNRDSDLYAHVMNTADSQGFEAARNELPEEYLANFQFSLSCLIDMRYALDMWSGQMNKESLMEVKAMRKRFDLQSEVVRARLGELLGASEKELADLTDDFVPEESYMEEAYQELEAEMGLLPYVLSYDTIERGYTAAKAYLEILDEESQSRVSI